MLPAPVQSAQGKLRSASRNILRRYWPVCIFFVALLWVSTTSLTPDRYRIRFLTESTQPTQPSAQVVAPRPSPRPPPVNVVEGDLWTERAHEVRGAFLHAYGAYQKYALPHDELKPLSAKPIDNFHGWGVTMYDSLDTMWLMGLGDLFNETVELISAETFDMKPTEYAHFFEVVIRYLGGLLSAYALSEDARLLKLADDLGEKLLPVFNTSSGFPIYGVNTVTGETKKNSPTISLAEAFTNQMEFKYLAHLTGKLSFYEATERPMTAMYGPENTMFEGLYGENWDVLTGKPVSTHYSVGGSADSAYEYFLKQWLMTGQREPKMRDLYVRSANAIIQHLLYLEPTRGLLYATDIRGDRPTHHSEHLMCFLPGLFVLGAHTPALGLSEHERERHLWAAEGLANMCWTAYNDTSSGLSPDGVTFPMGKTSGDDGRRWSARLTEWERAGRVGSPPGVADPAVTNSTTQAGRGYWSNNDAYLLRPETVESFYLMWRTTGNIKWRERGWAVFQSIQDFARVEQGFTSVRYLDRTPIHNDEMPSWFFAETLKYLFLLFTDEELVPLDKWVFNTEAHPLPVFQWTRKQIEEFRIEVLPSESESEPEAPTSTSTNKASWIPWTL